MLAGNGPDAMVIAQEPPDWMYAQMHVDGENRPIAHIVAQIEDNAALGQGWDLLVYSVLFPPASPYPNGRYLWTWYAHKRGETGLHGRPVTFMESASNVAEGGTGLALADYFDYQARLPGSPDELFRLPDCCRGMR